jgi:hypothetical protein
MRPGFFGGAASAVAAGAGCPVVVDDEAFDGVAVRAVVRVRFELL